MVPGGSRSKLLFCSKLTIIGVYAVLCRKISLLSYVAEAESGDFIWRHRRHFSLVAPIDVHMWYTVVHLHTATFVGNMKDEQKRLILQRK